MFGGPALSPEYSAELSEIKEALSGIEFAYDLDMSLTIGGDLVTVSDPTGLFSARIHLTKRLAKGLIQLNGHEALTADDPRALLRSVLQDAMKEMFDRIAAKDADFDVEAANTQLDFLTVKNR